MLRPEQSRRGMYHAAGTKRCAHRTDRNRLGHRCEFGLVATDSGAAGGGALELPIGLPGQLLGRAARRRGSAAMHRAQSGQAFPACRSAVNALAPAAPVQATTAPAPAAPAASAPVAPAPAASAPAQPPASAPSAQPAAAPVAAPPPAAAPAPSRATAPAAATPPKAAARPTAQQQAAIRQACQSDFMSRCRGVQPGGQAALACLKRNAARLSPGCQQAMGAIGAAQPAAAQPAAAPAAVAAPPPAVAPAPMPPLPPRVRLGIVRACQGDLNAACPNVPAGGGRLIDCLVQNEPALSPICRGALARARGL